MLSVFGEFLFTDVHGFTTGALALQAGEPCLRRMRLVRHKDAVIPPTKMARYQQMVGKSAESQIITGKKK